MPFGLVRSVFRVWRLISRGIESKGTPVVSGCNGFTVTAVTDARRAGLVKSRSEIGRRVGALSEPEAARGMCALSYSIVSTQSQR